MHDKYGGKTYRARCIFDRLNVHAFDYIVKSAKITRHACDFMIFFEAKPRYPCGPPFHIYIVQKLPGVDNDFSIPWSSFVRVEFVKITGKPARSKCPFLLYSLSTPIYLLVSIIAAFGVLSNR